jgi:ferredoxin-NADP reductase
MTMPSGAPASPAFGCRTFKEIIMAAQEIPLRYEAKLLNRVEVADDTMAFHFEKPPGFEFRPGQSSDLTLVNPPETDSEGNVRTFSIASAPFEDRLMFATRMRETAFKRSLKAMPIGTAVKVEPATGSSRCIRLPPNQRYFWAGESGSHLSSAL